MSIKMEEKDLKRIYYLLEEVNDVFHDSFKFKDSKIMEDFATEYYPEIRDLYYHVVWDYLPRDEQEKIKNR